MGRESLVGAPPASYFLVPLEHLEPETVLGFDLYMQRGTGDPLLYRSRDLPYSREVQERLLDHGVRDLLVPADQADEYHAYRRAHGAVEEKREPQLRVVERELTNLLADRAMPLRTRSATLLGVSRAVIEEAFADLASPGLQERVTRVAHETVRFLLREPRAFSSLVGLLESDLDVYNHSLRTSLYATELARVAGFGGEEALAAIGRAALVHDVGRGSVPLELLHRPVSREDRAWQPVMAHVDQGVSLLKDTGFADTVSLEVCAHHHERCDGSGYPRGLQRDQIPPAARVVAIADIFDSLTSSGRQHVALSGYQALWRLKHGHPGAFDPAYLNLFVRTLVRG
jgi:putative nucleotidyltransferase with HDIG domain